MKIKLFFFVFFIFAGILFFISQISSGYKNESAFLTPPITNDSFIIGAMDNGWDINYQYADTVLKFNTWHKYADGVGWTQVGASADLLNANISSYSGQVDAKIDNNYSNNMITIMDRWKISHLAYSQRSDYQCEDTLAAIHNDYWFYKYNTHSSNNMYDYTDNTQYGSGEKVRYCYPDPNQTDGGSSWVVKNLVTNREQVNRHHNPALNDSCVWHIIPRIRIDSIYVANPLNNNKDVCRIDVFNFDSVLIKSITLKVRNFKNQSGIYSGNYLDDIDDFNLIAGDSNFTILYGDLFNPNKKDMYDTLCGVDFRVWYYGNCKMWIDRIRVENDVAHNLLSNNPNNANYVLFNNWLEWECGLATSNPGKIQEFYIEEFEFNCLPSIKYVNHKIDSITSLTSQPHSLMVNLNYDLFNIHQPHAGWNSALYHTNSFNAEQLERYLWDYAGIKTLLTVSYALEGHTSVGWPQRASYHPPTLSSSDYDIPTGILSNKASTVQSYENRLQGRLDTNSREGTSFIYVMKVMDTLAKNTGMKLINLTQAHLHYATGHKLKEVSNEELDMLVNLAITYGSKGILYFAYHGFGCMTDTTYWIRGFLQPTSGCYGDPQPWTTNVYGQPKWDKAREINTRLQKLGHHFMNFNDANRNSFIYRLENERNALISNTYFNSVITVPPTPSDFDEPDFNNPDAPNNTLLQVATFKKDAEQFNNYFMVVNRRCSPFDSTGDWGGLRQVYVKFDSNHSVFSGFNNWKIIDLENNNTIGTFNKAQLSTINLGWVNPGSGKLYKVAPVMQEGGTFVTDESFGNVTVNCKGNVNNGGYDLTIAANTVIAFDSAKKITLTGGNFICGGVRETWEEEHIGNDVTMTGNGVNTYWDGLEISNCNIVSIGGTKIERVRGNSIYAINAYNCNTFRVRYNLFLSGSQNQQTGSVNFTFMPMEEVPAPPVIEITGNRIYHNSSNLPSVQLTNYSAGQSSALVRNNEFYGFSSDVGIFLNNITGGSIKSNNVINYIEGIVTTTSYVDLFKNHIENTNETSKGLSLNFGSIANLYLDPNITYQNSGINTMINYGSISNNIFVDNSYFTTRFGHNTFDVYETENHFYGIFDDYYNGGKEVAEYNCFKIGGDESTENTDVDWYSGGDVTFDTDPYSCERPEEDEFDTVVYAEDIIDTLWSFSGGFGGGYSNKQKISRITSEATLFELKTDSLNYFLRKRRFNEVKRIGNELTNSFSDSDRVADIIQPLYFSTMITDDANHTDISALKSKLENLISANPNNSRLVLRCNYFVQKCKVIIGHYQSALSGFYEIMQNYPYSWEGVVAGWDYSATQLISQGGSGGGESSLSAQQAELSYEPDGDDPKGTKKTIEKTLQKEKEKTEKQIKNDEQKVKELRSDVKNEKNIKQSKTLEKKLQQKKVMQEVIKPRKPETVIEHIKFVNSDIQKIYSVNDKTTDIKDNNSIPDKYSLSQNYPNPFNPVTKIKFELPKESKVTIVIYDILGRKVAQLINNELRQAGRYEVQFNGQNFASGIYFYRLVANDFIDTKRMVLIK